MPESRRRREGPFIQRSRGAQALAYDFAAARPPRKTMSVFESSAHLVKGCLGAGVVAIHNGYKISGLWSAFFLNIFLGFAVSYCVWILIKSAQIMYGRIQEPMLSYPDLAEASLAIGPFDKMRKYSRCFRYMVDFTITFDLFGSCCVYQVIIARTMKQLVENTQEVVDHAVGSSPNVRVYILTLLLPCIAITMILTLKYLAPFSIVADFFIVAVVGATVYYAGLAVDRPPTAYPIVNSWLGIFEYMGMCVFSMEGVGVAMAIENSMTEPKKFYIVLICGMTVVVSCVMTVGFMGYWGYGEDASSPVTVNFPMDETFPIILKVMMAIVIYVTFALNFWVPFDLVWYYLRKHHPVEKHWIWQRIYRAIAVTIITTLAALFPNIYNFIGLLGSFCLSNMGFIFPAFIELTLVWTDPGLGAGNWRLWKFVAILIFGVTLMVLGTYTNVKGLIATLLEGFE